MGDTVCSTSVRHCAPTPTTSTTTNTITTTISTISPTTSTTSTTSTPTATVPHSGGPSVPVSGCLVWTPSASPTTFQTAKHLARHRSHHRKETAKYHIMSSYFHPQSASNTSKTFCHQAPLRHTQSPLRQEIRESWKPCEGKNVWSLFVCQVPSLFSLGHWFQKWFCYCSRTAPSLG